MKKAREITDKIFPCLGKQTKVLVMTRAQLGQAYYKRLKVLVRIVCVTGERFFKIGFDIKNAGRTFCLELDFVFIPFIFLAQMLTFLCDSGSYATPQGNGRLIGVFSTLNLVGIPRIFGQFSSTWVSCGHFTTTSLVIVQIIQV